MLTMEQGRSGTLVFMSPQQLDGERGTPADDIYSFGATMYELITSKPPFSSGNIDRQIREKIPPTMAQRRKDLEVEGEMIDEVWEKVIASCLAKNPDRRPQSFVEIAQQLGIDSPKTVRAARALQPPTTTTVAAAVPPPVPATATSTTLPPLPKPAGLSPAKVALILGGVAALVLFVIVAISVWYFAFRKPAAPKSVAATTQKAPETQDTSKTSGMADKAKDIFKPEPRKPTRSEPSVAPKEVPPPAPPQPVVPVNDFTGG
jgi:serine/threonine protein kinase